MADARVRHFSVSVWYNILNQFMIQRVLGAKNMYHARMGIVFAGYIKILMPLIVVLPGLILFARFPEVMKLPWEEIKPEADKGYVAMLQMLVPAGLRGLFLAALFGAIQSTVNSVLNSTATVFTLDIYKRLLHKNALEKHLVRVGMLSSVIILVIAIGLAIYISVFSESLFVYVSRCMHSSRRVCGNIHIGDSLPPYQFSGATTAVCFGIHVRRPHESLCAVREPSPLVGAVL